MMATTKLIGITGNAGSGKDTVRSILERHGYIGLAFADPLRSMIHALLAPIGADWAYTHERHLKERPIPELGISYRHLAQTLGTEWGRHLDNDFWLRLAGLWMDRRGCAGESYCISDVRFVNEAAWVRQRGGVIWRVEREGVERVRSHVSESQIYSFAADRIIPNHGTPADLNDAVMAALHEQEATV